MANSVQQTQSLNSITRPIEEHSCESCTYAKRKLWNFFILYRLCKCDPNQDRSSVEHDPDPKVDDGVELHYNEKCTYQSYKQLKEGVTNHILERMCYCPRK